MKPWIEKQGKGPAEAMPVSEFNGFKYYACTVNSPIAGGVLNAETQIDWENLLELRAFGADKELWIHRTSLNRDFYFRIASDLIDGVELPKEYWFDKCQYLDIDDRKTPKAGNQIIATGGGSYTLPIAEGENMVRIRNYVTYSDKTGRAQIDDFRIVGFKKGE